MKKFIAAVFLSCATLFSTVQAEGIVKLPLDEWDQWHVDFQDVTGEVQTIKLTLKNETSDNWSELVTFQRFSKESSLTEYYNTFLKNLGQRVQSRLIMQDEKTILFEWWTEEQHAWVKVLENVQSVSALSYTTKKVGDVEKVRSTWERILQEATIESDQ